MKKIIIYALALFFLILIFLSQDRQCTTCSLPQEEDKETSEKPGDWFFRQRAFPDGEINYDAYWKAYDKAREMKKQARLKSKRNNWELVGPTNLGGRISAIAMHHEDMETIYAGAASGGVFKSTDGGSNWEPIFDDAASLSIGDIDVAPSNPHILYVGTGESNAGGGSLAYDGIGVYKSEDAGASWEYIGLEHSGSIGRVATHPDNPESVFVAAMGRLFSNNADRGIYRTQDGGDSWEQVLYVSDSTGGIDLVIHPEHPDTVYAAMWERVRRPHRRSYGGPTSGIYRSINGGDSWEELTQGLPSAASQNGRIGIDISKSDPNILYAIYADRIGYFQGVYKTTDHGDTWQATNDGALSNMYASYGWWFGRIHIDPTDPNVAYPIGFDLYKTTSGGNSWSNISGYSVHVDQHDLYVHPMNPDFAVLGNDGGVYLSDNAGNSWSQVDNLPVTQFYTCEIDAQPFEKRYYGGTQDLGTNRTMTGQIDDWENIYGGDGFYVLVDPEDNDYVYAEYQYGNFVRSTDGGNTFYSGTSGISYNDRKNWMTPFVFNPHNPASLYIGTNKLYKSTNRAQYWNAISGDLTNGPGSGNLTYGTITTIAVSPADTSTIWVGTDDSNVWVSKDNGGNWQNVSAQLPGRWVTRVAADPDDAATGYVTFSGYRYDSYIAHVYKTTDYGMSWENISGNLPEAPANDIIIDPSLDSMIYLATDFGMFYTDDNGQHWNSFGPTLPNVPIVDLTLNNETRDLVAATYGRSMYTYDLANIVGTEEPAAAMEQNISIYPNPFTDRVYINLNELDKGNLSVRIYDMQGRLIEELFSGKASQTGLKLQWQPANGVKKGVYMLEVISGDKRVTKKLMLE